MDKNDNKPINMADIEQHPAHIAKLEQLRSKEHIKASKNDTLVVIQYGSGKIVWYTKAEALEAIVFDFDYIESIYFAEKGDL